MIPKSPAECNPAAARQFTAEDVVAILRERGWLGAEGRSGAKLQRNPSLGREESTPRPAPSEPLAHETKTWLVEAAALLGPHAADHAALEDLLGLIFSYDTRAILDSAESHAVLARAGARDVIRELGNRIVGGPEIDSDRFKELIGEVKFAVRCRGRELFHPIRLALAGRAGEGKLDRVILLLDRAAKLGFNVRVKGTRQRMLEFCAALE